MTMLKSCGRVESGEAFIITRNALLMADSTSL
jgi:hypothetical protein